MAVELAPLASVPTPIAVEPGPLALVLNPSAIDNCPMLASSHCEPDTVPARKADFPGCHMRRAPAPVAGIAAPVVPPTKNPPSVFTCACPARLVAPLTVSCVSVTGPARNPPVASRCTSVLGTLSDVPDAGVTGTRPVRSTGAPGRPQAGPERQRRSGG